MDRPDDDLERSLRRYFEDFDQHYTDDAPSAEAWERIEAATQPAPKKWRRWLVGAVAVLLSLGCSTELGTLDLGGSTLEVGLRRTVNSTKADLRFATLDVRPVRQLDEKSARAQPSVKPTILPIRNQTYTKQVRTQKVRRPTTSGQEARTFADLSKNQQEPVFENRVRSLAPNFNLSDTPKRPLMEQKNQAAIPSQTLDFLDIVQLKMLPASKATPRVSVADAPVSEPTKTTKQLAWTVAVQPFQTFQYITNQSVPQDFSLLGIYTPHLTSTQRTGVQLRVGVERQKTARLSWRVAGFYRAMPQFVHYETSTNQFAVREIGPNQVAVERLGIEVKEQKMLQHLGLQADYLYRLGRRWFVSGGTEISANGAQPRWGFTASVGWQRPLSARHALVVEPTYTYFTSKTNDAKKLLQLQPYTIGLKVGVRILKN
jgi:hypothetical protein